MEAKAGGIALDRLAQLQELLGWRDGRRDNWMTRGGRSIEQSSDGMFHFNQSIWHYDGRHWVGLLAMAD